jgi:DNA methylase
MDFEVAQLPGVQWIAPPGQADVQSFDESAFHRWYNFILGFSDQFVGQILEAFSVSTEEVVLDPFCGTGTTMVECAKYGVPSIGVDANPFAVFAANAKCSFNLDPDALMRAAARVEDRYREIASSNRRLTDGSTYLYLNHSGMIDRGWISKKPLRKALALREAIQRGQDPSFRDVFMLALVADLPTNIGNMKFGPQIYKGPSKVDVDPLPLFWDRVKAMAKDLRNATDRKSFASPTILLGDARSLKPVLRKNFGHEIPKIDYVICSPPYPTEHDYTRHTRLELAFTEGVTTIECLRAIKRSMIRSHTKGIYKGDEDQLRTKMLTSVEKVAVDVELAVAGKESGFEKLYPTVVRSYFGGMKRHFGSLFRLMRKGGKAAYVVGDQAAYLRVPIRTAVLLGETAESVGFKVEETLRRQSPERKRRAPGEKVPEAVQLDHLRTLERLFMQDPIIVEAKVADGLEAELKGDLEDLFEYRKRYYSGPA